MSQMQRKLIVATVIGIGVLGMTGPTSVSFVSEAQAFGWDDLNPVKAAKKVGGAVKDAAKKVGGAVKDAAEEVGSTVKNGAKMGAGSVKLLAKDIKKGAKAVEEGFSIGIGVNAAAAGWVAGQAVRGAGKVLQSEGVEKLGKGVASVAGGCLGADSPGCLKRLGRGVFTGGMSESVKLHLNAAKVLTSGGRGKIGDPPVRPTVRDKRNRDKVQVYCVRAPCPKVPRIDLSKGRGRKQADRAGKLNKVKLNRRDKRIRCVRAPCNLRGSAEHRGKSRIKTHRRHGGKANVHDYRKNRRGRSHRRYQAKVESRRNSRQSGRQHDRRQSRHRR